MRAVGRLGGALRLWLAWRKSRGGVGGSQRRRKKKKKEFNGELARGAGALRRGRARLNCGRAGESLAISGKTPPEVSNHRDLMDGFLCGGRAG